MHEVLPWQADFQLLQVPQAPLRIHSTRMAAAGRIAAAVWLLLLLPAFLLLGPVTCIKGRTLVVGTQVKTDAWKDLHKSAESAGLRTQPTRGVASTGSAQTVSAIEVDIAASKPNLAVTFSSSLPL